MTDLIYVGAVLVGAVTLLIEAFRNFNSQTDHHPFSLHPILKNVEARSLCTNGEVVAGFAFYALFYLIVYAVVLGSAEVYQLLQNANSARNEVGATDNLHLPYIDPALISSTGYGKPIFISALLISFLSIGIVKPIEETMRSLAHKLAGIPRGVYKVIETLRYVDYTEIMSDQPGQLVLKFRAAAEPIAEKHLADKKRSIEASLAAIDCLSTATTVTERALYFPLYHMDELAALSKQLDENIDALHKSIEGLHEFTHPKNNSNLAVEEKTSMTDTDKNWEGLHFLIHQSAVVRADTMAVFAVLFVRNNRSIFSQSGLISRNSVKTIPAQNPIEKATINIHENYNAELNSFAVSLFVSMIISSVVTFYFYQAWHDWKAHGNSSLYIEYCANLDTGLVKSAPVASISTSDKNLNNIVNPECRKDEAILMYVNEQRPTHIAAAFWDTLKSGLLVCLSVFLVLIGRETRIEQQSWRTDWRFYQFPFLRLTAMSLLSGVVAIVASVSVELIKVIWDSAFQPTQTQIINLFETNGLYFVLQFGAGLVLAFAALVIMDKHQQSKWGWTVVVGAAFSGMYFAYMLFVSFVTYGGTLPISKGVPFPEGVRDAVILSLVPSLFLVLFAIMLEVTERGGPRSARGQFRIDEEEINSGIPARLTKADEH
jgi:hypothetical protein